MRLIKNVSPALIKVNISIQKTDGTNLNLWLNHGESILVQDTEVATKSLIIQNKKGNIDIIEYNDVANQLNFYQVYPAQKEKSATDIIDAEFQNPFEEENDNSEESPNNNTHLVEDAVTQNESVTLTEPVKSKGGRPKGSGNKKKKKKKTAKSKEKNIIKTEGNPNVETN